MGDTEPRPPFHWVHSRHDVDDTLHADADAIVSEASVRSCLQDHEAGRRSPDGADSTDHEREHGRVGLVHVGSICSSKDTDEKNR